MEHMHSEISSVKIVESALTVTWTDGMDFTFHPLWLRERSPDQETIDPKTTQRKIEAAFLPLELGVTDAACDGGSTVRLRFSDGVDGQYHSDMLRAAVEPAGDYDLLGTKELWDGTRNGFPRHRLPDLKAGKSSLLALLNDLARVGCVLVTDLPVEKNAVLEFAGLVGNIKLTNWGGVEDVKVEAKAFDLTLTGRGLEPHVDNPYRYSTIGYVLLHCLHNSCKGGESTVVDGFAVAERLRREHPEAFDALTTTPVYFRYEDENAILENYRPLIELTRDGKIKSVAYSNRTEFVRAAPVAEMTRYYRARQLFAELLYGDSMTVSFKLEPGQLAIFDNYRVLHGRRSFDAGTGERHMRQAYMDRDIVSSRQKVLMRDLRG